LTRAEVIASFNRASTSELDFSFEEVSDRLQAHLDSQRLNESVDYSEPSFTTPRTPINHLQTPQSSTPKTPSTLSPISNDTSDPWLFAYPIPEDTPLPINIVQPITVMATPIPMPTRNERTAPKFDTSRPRELPRFFEDLEDLMTRAQIALDTDKKKQAVRYTDFETEQIWKAVPEFKDNNKTYNDFKKAIMQHYPDAAGDFIYSIRDMDLLIGERQRIGMATAKDLSDYHLQFMAITTWLIEKARLSDLEQQRAYVRAFPTDLLQAINNRYSLSSLIITRAYHIKSPTYTQPRSSYYKAPHQSVSIRPRPRSRPRALQLTGP